MSRSLFFFLLVVLFVAGCHSNIVDPFDYPADPVARAVGVRWSWEPNRHFDAGIVIFRYHTGDTAGTGGSTDIRAAFDVNNNPVQVQSITVNGEHLPWIAHEQNLFHAQIYGKMNDTNSYGAVDSATFNFVGYDGESWAKTVRVAPDFGKIVGPDTITLSQGLRIGYGNPVPGDSIHVSIVEILTHDQAKGLPVDSIAYDAWLPDTGAIVVSSERLPHVSGGNEYTIQVYRFHFETQISTKGKTIGIYSDEEFPVWVWPFKM